MAIDEFYFHIKRGLGLWEALGHPLDTLSVAAPFSVIAFYDYSATSSYIFIALSALSCVFVTKDEFVHQKLCSWKEHWLHSILFMVHPLIFIAAYFLWQAPNTQLLGLSFQSFIQIQLIILVLFSIYQFTFWNKGRLF
jgi:hypothetical protein